MRASVLLLVTVSLTLCTHGSAAAADPRVASARGLYPVAQSAARAADPSAKLVGVTGVETTRPAAWMRVYDRVDSPSTRVRPQDVSSPGELFHTALRFTVTAAADPRVGDGRAPAWAFHFLGSAGERAVVVNARGSVRYHRAVPTTTPPPSGRFDEAWRVDSGALANDAATAVPAFTALRYRATVAIYMLDFKSSHPIWNLGLLVGGISPRVCELADVKVDARTGRVKARGTLYIEALGKQQGVRTPSRENARLCI
jgi:hypothetical protein